MEKEEKYQISYQNYDFLFKNALEVFKDQTFDFLGVNCPKIVKAERTEYKEIETKTDMMDLNFLLEDGTVLQLEEEVSVSLEDMIRFARYNMMLYQQYRTEIHSLILTMDKNQKEEERLDTGSLKFEPEIINLGKRDGDRYLKELKEKIRNGEEINELELIFLPVMDTKEDKTVYIKEIIEIEKSLSREEKRREKESANHRNDIGSGEQVFRDGNLRSNMGGSENAGSIRVRREERIRTGNRTRNGKGY